jgi:hypothetical protein
MKKSGSLIFIFFNILFYFILIELSESLHLIIVKLFSCTRRIMLTSRLTLLVSL